MRKLALAAGLCVLAISAHAEEAGPASTAKAFYAVTTQLKEGGIPDAANRKTLAPYISPSLHTLLAQADRASLAYADNTKHAVPPLLEGDIFSSLFEGATAFKLGACTDKGAETVCDVELSYADGDAPAEHWTDRVILTKGAEGWRVDDIDYGGKWPFANKGTLKQNLEFAIQNASGEND